MKDQVMIVTGAAMGLGLAAAKVLAARGAAGALVDYNADALKTAQAELAADCPQAKSRLSFRWPFRWWRAPPSWRR